MIRLCATYSLIFFVSGLLAACRQPDNDHITIRWNGNRAIGISIPSHSLQSVPVDSLDQLLSVRLADKETAIAGNYQRVDNDIIFEPVVPFTRGLHYVVWLRNSRLDEIIIPNLSTNDQPALLAIYPSQDSLPDNLLKIYLRFSRPMREGQSQKYITLLRNKTDKLSGVFLDLQPELWNADRTLLTLWLDPGRIKRDLQPNKLLGTPLRIGNQYQLTVSADWTDEQGATLQKPVTKTFLSVQRDSLLPAPAQWTMQKPVAGSAQPLQVAFGEALDYSLLMETLHIFQPDGQPVSGKWLLSDEEKRGSFKPDEAWKMGRYSLQIENRLEDLAGNNLNRPFDRDITRKRVGSTAHPVVQLFFTIQ